MVQKIFTVIVKIWACLFLLHYEYMLIHTYRSFKQIKNKKNKNTTCGTDTGLSGPSFYLKVLVKKGHNSKNIAFRVMFFALHVHLVMMSKYAKFGVDTFNTFWVMGYIKIIAHQHWQSSDHNGFFFLRNRLAKNKLTIICIPLSELLYLLCNYMQFVFLTSQLTSTCIISL